jgi:hypothetical protein
MSVAHYPEALQGDKAAAYFEICQYDLHRTLNSREAFGY